MLCLYERHPESSHFLMELDSKNTYETTHKREDSEFATRTLRNVNCYGKIEGIKEKIYHD
jgi:hypothetical protein